MDEDPAYAQMEIPRGEQGRRDLLRALMNVRLPAPVPQEFLDIQDAYLKEENARDIVDAEGLAPCPRDPRLSLWQGDITRLKIDAIVNAANSGMTGCYQPLHNCIDNIIHTKAGVALRCRCHEIMLAQGYEEPTGRAKITPGYDLPCRYVLHTVGPIVQGELTQTHEALLASCYRECLKLAAEHGIRQIAFCCISTGVFRFPQRRAAQIAVRTVRETLDALGAQMRVVFNVFRDEDLHFYRELLYDGSGN